MVIFFFFFFNDTATTEIYTVMNTLSLHDALPIWPHADAHRALHTLIRRADVRLRSEEHTSELQSLITISYAVFCLKKKKKLQHKTQSSPPLIQSTTKKKKKSK